MAREEKKGVEATLIGRRGGSGMLAFGMQIDDVVETEEPDLSYIDDPEVKQTIEERANTDQTDEVQPAPLQTTSSEEDKDGDETAPSSPPDLSKYAEESIKETLEEKPQQNVDDLRQNSYAANAALALQQEGVLPEDFEVSPDMTGIEFKTVVLEALQKEHDRRVAASNDEELLRFLDYVRKGGDVEALVNSLENRKFTNLNTKGESDEAVANKKQLIEARYMHSLGDETRVKRIVQDIFEKDEFGEYNFEEIDREADISEKYFSDIEEQDIRQRELELEQAERERKRHQEQFEQTLKQKINSGQLGSYKLAKDESKKLMDFIFKPSETIDVPDANGRIVPTPATGYTKQMYLLNQDIDKQLVLAKLLMDGFDLESVKAQGKTELSDNLLDKLNSSSQSEKGRGQEQLIVKREKPKIKSTPVGRYRPNSY